MVSRTFCIPGIFFLVCAFVLSFLVSISLPYLTGLDIVRVHFPGTAGTGTSSGQAISQLRFGIWAFCYDLQQSGNEECSAKGHGYSVSVSDPTQTNTSVIVASSWTRGLAVHPVATAVTFVALLLSFSTHVTVALLASITSFLAALLTLIAFAIDIALYAWVHHQMGKLSGSRENTNTAPGFWLTFVSLILLLLSGCTVCFGRRRERMGNSTSYPMTTGKRRRWPFSKV